MPKIATLMFGEPRRRKRRVVTPLSSNAVNRDGGHPPQADGARERPGAKHRPYYYCCNALSPSPSLRLPRFIAFFLKGVPNAERRSKRKKGGPVIFSEPPSALLTPLRSNAALESHHCVALSSALDSKHHSKPWPHLSNTKLTKLTILPN